MQLSSPHLRKDLAGLEKGNWNLNSWEDGEAALWKETKKASAPVLGEKTKTEYDQGL